MVHPVPRSMTGAAAGQRRSPRRGPPGLARVGAFTAAAVAAIAAGNAVVVLAAVAGATLAPRVALAAEPIAPGDRVLVKPGPVGAATAAPHRLREDGRVQELWIDPTREAVVDASDGARSAMSLRPRGAGVAAGRPADSSPAGPKDGAIGPGVDPANGSPVFVDAAGNPRALPGGVIVTFAAPLADAQALSRIEGAGAIAERRIGPRSWLVQTASGMAALETSDALRASGRFESVEPNWWRPPTLK